MLLNFLKLMVYYYSIQQIYYTDLIQKSISFY
jgi:hypothetical protein